VHLVCLLADVEINLIRESSSESEWKVAMDEEITAIEKNKIWEITNLSKGHKPIRVKWVYKKKMTPQDTIERHKVRLIVKGYRQKTGIDYDQATDIFKKVLPKPLFENYKQIVGMMKERDLSLREDVESNKLQVLIPKDQELRNPTTSRCLMPNSKKQ
jgi:Reverse transcriptase (RNA-dependent DNA polymerase)